MSPTPEPDLRPAHLRFFRCRSISVNGSELGLMPAFIQEKDFADGVDKPLTPNFCQKTGLLHRLQRRYHGDLRV